MKLLQMKALLVENNLDIASKIDIQILELIRYDFSNSNESHITNIILYIGKLFNIMTGVIKNPFKIYN